MNITYFNSPFPHVIIYNHFDESDEIKIRNEIKTLELNDASFKHANTDEHHSRLLSQNKVETYMLDNIYLGKRETSSILHCITKVYYMSQDGTLDTDKFRNLEYVKDSNADNCMLHSYKDASSYFEHDDKAVLTFLYVFWDTPKPFTGGELLFTKYGYEPKLENNCCLIFPSYEKHLVKQIHSNQQGVVRWAINHRIFIKN